MPLQEPGRRGGLSFFAFCGRFEIVLDRDISRGPRSTAACLDFTSSHESDLQLLYATVDSALRSATAVWREAVVLAVIPQPCQPPVTHLHYLPAEFHACMNLNPSPTYCASSAGIPPSMLRLNFINSAVREKPRGTSGGSECRTCMTPVYQRSSRSAVQDGRST